MNHPHWALNRFVHNVSLELENLNIEDQEVNHFCSQIEEELMDKYPSARNISRLITHIHCFPQKRRKIKIEFEILL